MPHDGEHLPGDGGSPRRKDHEVLPPVVMRLLNCRDEVQARFTTTIERAKIAKMLRDGVRSHAAPEC